MAATHQVRYAGWRRKITVPFRKSILEILSYDFQYKTEECSRRAPFWLHASSCLQHHQTFLVLALTFHGYCACACFLHWSRISRLSSVISRYQLRWGRLMDSFGAAATLALKCGASMCRGVCTSGLFASALDVHQCSPYGLYWVCCWYSYSRPVMIIRGLLVAQAQVLRSQNYFYCSADMPRTFCKCQFECMHGETFTRHNGCAPILGGMVQLNVQRVKHR